MKVTFYNIRADWRREGSVTLLEDGTLEAEGAPWVHEQITRPAGNMVILRGKLVEPTEGERYLRALAMQYNVGSTTEVVIEE